MAYVNFLNMASPSPTRQALLRPPPTPPPVFKRVVPPGSFGPPVPPSPAGPTRPGAQSEPAGAAAAPTAGGAGVIAAGNPATPRIKPPAGYTGGLLNANPGPPDDPRRGAGTPPSTPPPGTPPPDEKPKTGAVADPYDLNQDPGYTRALSQYYAKEGTAASDYLSQVEQSLLGFGSRQLAEKTLAGILPELERMMQQAGTLGKGQHLDLSDFYKSFYLHDANGNQLTDAQGNPLGIDDKDQGLSILSRLGRNAFNATKETINANRLGNLSHGLAGANDLAETGYGNSLAQNEAASQQAQQLSQYLSGYRGTLSGAQDNLNSEADSAYNRLVQLALAHHTGDPPAKPKPKTKAGAGVGAKDAAGRALAARSKGLNAFYGL